MFRTIKQKLRNAVDIKRKTTQVIEPVREDIKGLQADIKNVAHALYTIALAVIILAVSIQVGVFL
jgi:hypothetical protein